MKLAYVPGEQGAYIEKLMDRSNDEWDKNNFEKSILLLEEAWEEIPEDKNIYDESFLIVWGILEISIQIGDYDRLRHWVDRIFTADPERGDFGEREMWAGRVAYELGEFSKAKKYIEIAVTKSRGKCFSSKDDGKYLKFYKEN
ncbi:hypothetical protein [Bacillus sp. 491mf]|uniref:hypothetical protein n=1 Tax=Bacillus sp. 491mf TaxID=1761755 RepID=UPI00210A2B16|nr:hypothetical protein [Bacillus sp. 491mf]